MAREFTISVKGMHCDGCEKNVAFALRELAGVVEVEADHRAETVRVTVAEDGAGVDKLVQAIEAMGYEVAR